MMKRSRYNGPPQTKADSRSESESIVAEFLAKGGTVKRMPDVEATAFACKTCGHTGIAGFAPGKARKCPKCRSPL
jgi:predicted nucleic-acid-binding Zn-ribbon protein